jgi:nuclear protein localization family protein 4
MLSAGDEKNNGEVKPEVFMISDQGQALEKYHLFAETEERKLMKVRVSQDPKEALPQFICGGKPVTEFEPEFLLVKLAHGSSKSNKFAYLKSSEFPAVHNGTLTKDSLKQYLKMNKHKKPCAKYGDFNLLLHLADLCDIDTAISVANCVQSEVPVPESIDDMITQKSEIC